VFCLLIEIATDRQAPAIPLVILVYESVCRSHLKLKALPVHLMFSHTTHSNYLHNTILTGNLLHQSATSTAALHLVEQNTRQAENSMINAYKTSLATTTHNIKKARHPNPLLDAYVLNVGELMWRSQTYPGVRGSIPTSRIHFSSACIGHYVFVIGGAEPTSLKYKHCETSSVVYVCDSRSMKWSIVNAINSNDHLKEPMRIAQADVIRAVRRCDEEKLRGISLGEYP